MIPGSAEALVRLRDLGMGIVVVTNQAEVGRGNLDPAELERIHERLRALLAADGASAGRDRGVPAPARGPLRLPQARPGMALRAADRFGFDPADSVVIGDHVSDLGLGRAIGATTILVRTGHGAAAEADADGLADHVADDLAGAVDYHRRARGTGGLNGGPADGQDGARERAGTRTSPTPPRC